MNLLTPVLVVLRLNDIMRKAGRISVMCVKRSQSIPSYESTKNYRLPDIPGYFEIGKSVYKVLLL